MLVGDIPPEFWRVFCEDIDHPIACTCPAHKFIWCNGAYELLVGYSLAELLGRTWLSITDQHDVGGDLASAQALLEGHQSRYSISKNYRHKRGHLVPVDITVRRFPVHPTSDLSCFRIEAAPARCTRDELDRVRHDMTTALADLRRDMGNRTGITGAVEVNVGDQWRDGDKVGRDKSHNSTRAMQFMAAALVAIAVVLAWGMYYQATVAKPGVTPAAPPAAIAQP